MKKFAIFVCFAVALSTCASIAFGIETGKKKVTITVVNSETGGAIGGLKLSAKIESRPLSRIEVATDENGQFQIDADYTGSKVNVSFFGLQSDWTEIKEKGTIVKCRHEDFQVKMINPWGHSRPSPPKHK